MDVHLKHSFFLLILFFSLIFQIKIALAAVITVCASGCNSTTVQGGINLAVTGDEVRIIDSREYNESVNVNKSITLTSNSSTKPTIFGNFNPILNISSNNVKVANIFIKSNVSSFRDGIKLESNNSELVNLTVLTTDQNSDGIESASLVSNISISNTEINTTTTSNGGAAAIRISSSTNFTLIGNKLNSVDGRNLDIGGSSPSHFNHSIDTTNLGNGEVIFYYFNASSLLIENLTNASVIFVAYSKNITIRNVTLDKEGVVFKLTNDSSIKSSRIDILKKDMPTIFFDKSGNNLIESNNMSTSDVQAIGIDFLDSSNNVIAANNISTSSLLSRGIRLSFAVSGSNNNVISQTTILTQAGLSAFGIDIDSSKNNTVKDSSINATQVFDIRLSGTTAGSNNHIINSTFNKSDIGFASSSVQTKVFVQYYLDVLVQDTNNNPINAATVLGNDTNSVANIENPTSNFTATTNSSGYISQQTLSEFMSNGTYNSTSGYLFFTNYTINASKTGFVTQSKQVNLTASQTLVFNLASTVGRVVTLLLSAIRVWWNDTITVSGNVTENESPLASEPVNTTVGSEKCNNTTASDGSYRCTFTSPDEVGIYNLTVVSGSASNTATLFVRPNYGELPIGTTPRAVYEQPMIMQEPSGRIRIVIVRIVAWRSG